MGSILALDKTFYPRHCCFNLILVRLLVNRIEKKKVLKRSVMVDIFEIFGLRSYYAQIKVFGQKSKTYA